MSDPELREDEPEEDRDAEPEVEAHVRDDDHADEPPPPRRIEMDF